MRKIEFIMGMPVIIEIISSKADKIVKESDFKKVFDYFRYIDEKFSPYKKNSEITKLNDGRLKRDYASSDMKLILQLSSETKELSNGYFDINLRGASINPSGIVKGWAIYNASKLL